MEKHGTTGQATDDNVTRCVDLHAGYLRLHTNTHVRNVIFVVFLLPEWLYESASNVTLYVHCLLVVFRIQEKREWNFQTRLTDVHV